MSKDSLAEDVGRPQRRALAILSLQGTDKRAQSQALCREQRRTVEDFSGSFSDENIVCSVYRLPGRGSCKRVSLPGRQSVLATRKPAFSS